MNDFSFKELYDVSLKATLPIEVGGKVIEVGEIVALFDKIQIANFQEIKQTTSAQGGYGNKTQMIWENTKELRLNFTQGIFSKTQLALMSNNNLVSIPKAETILVDFRERVETNQQGIAFLKHNIQKPIFVYDAKTGNKMSGWSFANNEVHVGELYKSLIVDYRFLYNNGCQILRVGQPLSNGYFSLNGKIRVKDDTTGKVVTGIIKIPKLRLMSDLSIRVGSDAIPQVGRLDAVAVPEGARGQQKVMEIIFLNDDIDADM